MSFHRVLVVAVATLFTVGMTSIASANCCGWGYSAPVAYAPMTPAVYGGCGACAAPTAAAVYAQPVAPAPIMVNPVVPTAFGGPCCGWSGCGNCGWSDWSGGCGNCGVTAWNGGGCGNCGYGGGGGCGGVRSGRLCRGLALCGQSGPGLFRPGHHERMRPIRRRPPTCRPPTIPTCRAPVMATVTAPCRLIRRITGTRIIGRALLTARRTCIAITARRAGATIGDRKRSSVKLRRPALRAFACGPSVV